MQSESSISKMLWALGGQQDQLASISSYAVARGAQKFADGKYADAVVEFRRAVAANPNNLDAHNYLATTYSALGKYREAIAASKVAVRQNPASATAHNNLAKIYLDNQQFDDAEKELKLAARLEPTDTFSRYSLGHIALRNGNNDEALRLFTQVTKLSPKDGNAYYGLGLTLNKLGRASDAVVELNKAIALKKDFPEAHLELGNAYAALGRKDEAKGELQILNDLESSLADNLQETLFVPAIIAAYSSNLDITSGPKTPLYMLDASLVTPGATKDFSMVFHFNADMEMSSITNITNWQISKANGGEAGYYNYGINDTPAQETAVLPLPKVVTYDPSSYSATVTFTLQQNDNGNGVIDPSHLVFSFSGVDITGKQVDTAADQYSGLLGRAF
jgi:tetratricopeptide (TPR) repeat protein